MRMTEIRKKAQELGVRASGAKKVDLIRSIQIAEGNIPCFGTEVNTVERKGAFGAMIA